MQQLIQQLYSSSNSNSSNYHHHQQQAYRHTLAPEASTAPLKLTAVGKTEASTMETTPASMVFHICLPDWSKQLEIMLILTL